MNPKPQENREKIKEMIDAIDKKYSPLPPQKEEWEKEFDFKIANYDKDGGFIGFIGDYANSDFNVDLIKSFIHQVIARERKKERAECNLKHCEILSRLAFKTRTSKELDLIELAQKQILSTLTPKDNE